jgi:dTMP kinase
MVYSAAKRNPMLSLDWAKAPDVGLPKPDAVVFLDLEPEEAEKRGGYGDEKYEKKDMQQRVRELFLTFKSELMVVNAGESVEMVGDRIVEKIEETLKVISMGESQIGKFET